jgi:dihydroorotase
MKLLLKGGLIVDPSQDLEKKCDLLIADGRVEALGHSLRADDAETVEVGGCIVTPGWVDMHVHLREPGREDKETIETGCRAAVAGGFTSVACMPNTTPVNDSETVTQYIVRRAKQVRLANVFPVGAITKGSLGEELAEIGEMVRAGAVAISDDGRPVHNNQVMRRAMEYATIFDVPVLDHCEDLQLAAGGCMNEGAVSTELGLAGLSRAAEELHVARDIMLARVTGAAVHICHLSTRESLEWIRRAKDQGIRVTCEATPHHFLLTEEALRSYDSNFKMNPPLREPADVEAMVEGLIDGAIDCVATDHAPHTRLDKEVPFEEAANGVVGLETAAALVWHHLVGPGRISLSRAVELMSVNPSRILKLDRGTLKVGAVADVTVIDPNLELEVRGESFHSKGRNSPFLGQRLTGGPCLTIVDGVVVWSRQSGPAR